MRTKRLNNQTTGGGLNSVRNYVLPDSSAAAAVGAAIIGFDGADEQFWRRFPRTNNFGGVFRGRQATTYNTGHRIR